MQATELLLHTFPSADTAFRFAVAGAFDVVALAGHLFLDDKPQVFFIIYYK